MTSEPVPGGILSKVKWGNILLDSIRQINIKPWNSLILQRPVRYLLKWRLKALGGLQINTIWPPIVFIIGSASSRARHYLNVFQTLFPAFSSLASLTCRPQRECDSCSGTDSQLCCSMLHNIKYPVKLCACK